MLNLEYTEEEILNYPPTFPELGTGCPKELALWDKLFNKISGSEEDAREKQ